MSHLEINTLVQLKGLRFIHINARSLVNKLQEIHGHYKHCDVMIITETWLNSSIPDEVIMLPNYRVIRQDRHVADLRKGGGICIYVKNTCIVENLHHVSEVTEDYELLCVKAKFGNIKPCYIFGVYRPPKGKPGELFEKLSDSLSDLDLSRNELYVMGDMNIDYKSKDQLKKLNLKNFESRFNIKQFINTATRTTETTATTLDWIYANSNNISNSGTINHNLSDHLPVFIVRKKT